VFHGRGSSTHEGFEQVRKFFQVTTVVGLVLTLSTAMGSAADATTRQVALGIAEFNQNNQANGGFKDLSGAETYKSETGRYPAIWHVWSDWGSNSTGPFDTTLMDQIFAKGGMIPLVTWEPLDPASASCDSWQLDKIIDGSHDQYIKDWAQAASSYHHTILLRFAHEMNGYWFVWGASRCSNTAAKYVAAWKHVWNLFKGPGGAGATNVKFVWNPSGSAAIKAFYPGNTYVDYVGVTAFNWGGYDHFGWRSMVGAFKGTMAKFANAGINKPVIGVEVGSASNDKMKNCTTCSKPDWITTGYQAVYTKWPKIKAIVYFDVNMLPITNNVQPNWRLNNPAAALTAYEGIAAMLKFQGVIPSN
jgi:mannan endo-1,4-beta-mannosidase